MELIRATLREQRGEIAPIGGVILLISILVLSAVMQINYAFTTVDMVKEKTNAAVLAVTASNVDKVHNGIHEGSGTARSFSGGAWNRLVSTDAVIHNLEISLEATRSGATLVRDNGVQLASINTTATNLDGGKLNFTTTLTIYIPLSFAGGVLPPIQHNLVVYTTYETKF